MKNSFLDWETEFFTRANESTVHFYAYGENPCCLYQDRKQKVKSKMKQDSMVISNLDITNFFKEIVQNKIREQIDIRTSEKLSITR